MKTVEQSKIYRESFAALQNGDWFDARRREAFGRFKTLGLPTRREAIWKNVPFERVLDAAYAASCEDCLETADRKILELYFLSHDEKNRVVFINGFYSKKFSSRQALPAGAVLTDLPSAIRDEENLVKPYLARDAAAETDAFAAINTFSFSDGAFLYVPAGVKADSPVHFLFVNVGQSPEAIVYYPRILAVLGPSAKASIVINHVELSKEAHLMNAAAEFYLEEGALLDAVELQRADGTGAHFLATRFHLERQSRVEATFFVQGGSLTRHDVRADLCGEGGEARLKGLTVLKGESQAFFNATASHLVPRGGSDQFFKSIVADKARSEFDSMVYVAKGAVKSSSRQLNKNLVLSDTAEAFSRPQLQIDNDDVSCAHGATVGQLEKAELFYLRSRGLSQEVARFLLIYGFAEEIIEDLAEGPLRAHVETVLNHELGKITGESHADGPRNA